jgi:hypothetical protein
MHSNNNQFKLATMNSENYSNLLQHYLNQGLKKQDTTDSSKTNSNNPDDLSTGPFDIGNFQKHFGLAEDKVLLEPISIFDESIDILTQAHSDSEDSSINKKPKATWEHKENPEPPNAGNTDTDTDTDAPFHKDFKTGNNNPIPVTPRARTPRQKQLHLVTAKKLTPLQEKRATDSSTYAISSISTRKESNLKSTAITNAEESFSDTSTENANGTIPSIAYKRNTSGKNLKPASNKLPPNSSTRVLDLAPELECLRKLILSQHEVFTPYLLELGNTNLTYSKQIEKKKENYDLLKNNEKIPRSLRIKCDLTTSPKYTSNPNFLQLKDNLKDIVKEFIQKGSKVMTEWAKINIQLLQHDRCYSILSIALKILDGLASFNADVIGKPNWPSVNPKHTTLYLFKVYLLHIFFNHEDLLEFLELSQENILLIGAKIITKKESTEEVNNIINALNISDIDDSNEITYEFMAETLTQFDKLFKATTITLWQYNVELSKRAAAVHNLKAKMQSLEVINATQATANALARATEHLSEKTSQEEEKELRMTNLEKNFKKQEQKTNEIANKLKSFNHKQTRTRKNSMGSLSTESMVSPTPKTLAQSKYNKRQRMVDLTGDEDYDEDNLYNIETIAGLQSPPSPKIGHRSKRIKNIQYSSPPQEKSIQWRQAEVLQYNPNFPAAHPSLIPATQPLTPMSFNTAINPPFFPPAPAPKPLTAPSPNPFYNQLGSQRALTSQPVIGQSQPKTPHTNAFNPFNPFMQTNPSFHHHKGSNRNNSRNTKRGRNTQKQRKPYQGAYFTE